MLYFMKRVCSVIKSVNVNTHLWCLSVLGGAILLCVSFFVEPSSRHFVAVAEDTKALASKKVIEYSSVLGGLSKIEALEEEEFDEIAQSMPEHFDSDPETELKDNLGIGTERDVMVDVSNVYSAEAIDALERLVQCEAATEDEDGKALVASVVLNRVDTGIWGDDILSVIESPGQFQPVDNGAYKVAVADSSTKEAVIAALLEDDISHGALYFQKSTAKVWGDKQYLFRHGSHSFYK